MGCHSWSSVGHSGSQGALENGSQRLEWIKKKLEWAQIPRTFHHTGPKISISGKHLLHRRETKRSVFMSSFGEVPVPYNGLNTKWHKLLAVFTSVPYILNYQEDRVLEKPRSIFFLSLRIIPNWSSSQNTIIFSNLCNLGSSIYSLHTHSWKPIITIETWDTSLWGNWSYFQTNLLTCNFKLVTSSQVSIYTHT